MIEACKFYNIVVEAIRLVNRATGYDARSEDESKEYFQPLKV